MPDFLQTFCIQIIPLVIAIISHEISHGAVAYALGDDTAKKAGRFKLHTHFDLYGSFLIPLGLYLVHSPFMIGYAKPVPIDPRKFKDPLFDMALSAAAGPACNLFLAVITSLFIQNITEDTNPILVQMIVNFIVINLVLFFFNLIPIPPLDGSRLVAAVLPEKALIKYYSIEQFGFFIILGIEFICAQISSATGVQIGLFHSILQKPVLATLNFLLS